MSTVLPDGAGECAAGLIQAVGGTAGGERGARLNARRPPESNHVAVILVGAGTCVDVDDAAGGASVLGGEGIGEDGELLDRRQRNVGEQGLAAPRVIAGAAIHDEGRLTPAA